VAEPDLAELRRLVEARSWWHKIDLGHGIVTPGCDDSHTKLRACQLPERLDGLSVLDIGTWDGFFAFEAERRGAARVVAVEYQCWIDPPGPPFGKDGFDLAHRVLHSSAEPVISYVEDLSADRLGTFDVVLFLGVLYHAEDPMRYLRICRSLCRGQLIVETHLDACEYARPAAVFYPGGHPEQ
jgi:tRNA (mo5U34)-methyltransferase